jgi:hypothetical protein
MTVRATSTVPCPTGKLLRIAAGAEVRFRGSAEQAVT